MAQDEAPQEQGPKGLGEYAWARGSEGDVSASCWVGDGPRGPPGSQSRLRHSPRSFNPGPESVEMSPAPRRG